MKGYQHALKFVLAGLVLAVAVPAFADEIINDDLIVTGDACVGAACVDGEEFNFLGVKIKNDNPRILFDDTSGGTFPANDWMVGITDNATAGTANFVIEDASHGSKVLVLEPGTDGGIALGSGSSLETNAVSVGDSGTERRIMHVADGVDDTDALNKGQVDERVAESVASLEERMDDIETRVSDLADRIDDL